MRIGYSKKFLKQLKKSPKKIQISFYEKLEIFIKNQNNVVLRKHQLSGEFKKLYSINITGDWRAIYEKYDNEDIVFVMIGTHSQLYK